MDGIAFIKYVTLEAQDADDYISSICLSLRKVAKDTEYRVAVSYPSNTQPSERVKKYCASVFVTMPKTEQQKAKVACEEMLSEKLRPHGFRTASELVLDTSYYTLDEDTEWENLCSFMDVDGDVNGQCKGEPPRGYCIQSVVAVCKDMPFWLVREGKVQKDSRAAMKQLIHDAQGIDATRLARLWKPSERWEAFSKGKPPLESIAQISSISGDPESDSEYFTAEEELASEYFSAEEEIASDSEYFDAKEFQ